MINAFHVKLKIGIELYRTTKHEMLSVLFLSMRRLRVNGKEAKSMKRRVIEKVVEYKYIPRHLHIISFEHVIFYGQKG